MSATAAASDPVTAYGLTALPASFSAGPFPATVHPSALTASDLAIPDTALARRIDALARARLPPDTYRHSLRVYSYGVAIARECFPGVADDAGGSLEETWFLTAMLHDIGTPDDVMDSTALSYEFWAGMFALQVLQEQQQQEDERAGGDGEETAAAVAPRLQAESVCEAILRHQDVQDKGMITLMTRLIHLGTLLDNVGANAELVNRGTIEAVVAELPRKGWGGCFSGTVQREKSKKPWAMVSRIEGFEGMIDGNKTMKQWD